MKPSIVVLTNSSAAARQARAYAAVLAPPLGAEVHLVHVYPSPLISSRVAVIMEATKEPYVRKERHALEQLAADYPVPATADTLEGNWDEAVQQGHGWVHKLLIDSVTEQVLRETTVPVLLLPAPTAGPEE